MYFLLIKFGESSVLLTKIISIQSNVFSYSFACVFSINVTKHPNAYQIFFLISVRSFGFLALLIRVFFQLYE